MQYSKRIEIICKHIPFCDYFADIGCDHGYCTEYVLKNNLCKEAMIADVSISSLKKAEKLLFNYLENGRLKSICTNGLQSIDRKYQQVLIAGMGGEEIISILKNGFLPQTLILQPMKNVDKVRKFLLENHYGIIKDFTFWDKKYYDLIVAEKNSKLQVEYRHLELEYGYDNLHAPTYDFVKKIKEEIEKYKNRPQCAKITKKLNELYEVECEINRYFSNT